jgi:RES domain
MAAFKSGWDWINFDRDVRTGSRYIHSKHVTWFLKTLVATSASRLKILPKGHRLWRAQRGCSQKNVTRRMDLFDLLVVETEVALPPKRMRPLKKSAQEGRVNPKGIPCLYLATDKNTAMAEVRPWLDAKVSLAQFKTVSELRLVDFAVNHDSPLPPGLLSKRCPPDVANNGVWSFVDRAFSKPVGENLLTADYAPTQIIAEVFRHEGFDGIQYKSRLGTGFNVALFDLHAAELVNSSLFSAKSVQYEFTKIRPITK